MRIVNDKGRLGLLVDGGVLDVASASDGRYGPDVQRVYDEWDDFRDWAGRQDGSSAVAPVDEATLGPPAPAPRQVFALGLNYLDHAEEAGMGIPTDGMIVFTKFPSSITGPNADVELPPGSVDFESELVVIIGRRAHRVSAEQAWQYVAGLTVGQDLSERELQLRPPSPQFSLGKSFPGFSPMGPCLVTPDEFADRDDLKIECTLNGAVMQQSSTKLMIFSIAETVARLSATLPLLAGDVIFTGTPAGIGWARDPKVLIQSGDELVTSIEGIGSLRNRFV